MRGRLRRHEAEDGFTLVEVVVGLTLFGLLLSSVSVAMASMLTHARNNANRSVASDLATRVVDRMHAIPAKQLPNGPLPDQVFRSGSTVYTVSATAELVPGNGTASACEGGGGLSAKRLSVQVRWTGMGTTRPVRSDTLRQLTFGEIDPTVGSLSMRVVDRGGAAVPDQQITLTPGGSTLPTDTTGCAVFTGLSSGAYTASLVPRNGWVDPQGATTASRAVTVVGGALTRDAGFVFDRAATLQLTWSLSTNDLATYPALGTPGASLGTSAFTGGYRTYPTPCGTPYCSTATPTGVSIGGLFPAASATAYRPWAGSCLDSKPTTTTAAVVLPQGGTASANVPLARVAVTVQDRNGAAKNKQVVTVTHVADSACPAGLTVVVPAPTGNTNVSRLALPAGTWSFSSLAGPAVQLALQPGSTIGAVTVKQP